MVCEIYQFPSEHQMHIVYSFREGILKTVYVTCVGEYFLGLKKAFFRLRCMCVDACVLIIVVVFMILFAQMLSIMLQLYENWKFHKPRIASYWLVKLDSIKRRKVGNPSQ